MDDELHRPLGQNIGREPARAALTPRQLAVGASVALVVGIGALVAFAPRGPLDAKFGGRPYAIAKIEPYVPPPPEPAAPVVRREASPPPAESAAEAASTGAPVARNGSDHIASEGDVEIQNGVRVVRTTGGTAVAAGGTNPMIIEIAPASGVRLAPAPDKRVSEKGRYGVLPRIGADGAKPRDVYSRPFIASAKLKAGAPKIAIVVGGLGLNAQSTQAAIGDLPESVTLAFAPYGASVANDAARARARGHETLLQAPMEPFNYPQTDPGPHTLRVEGDAADDLQWLMSRFSGYAGVASFLGGRFTADEKALTPVLTELAQRGLFVIDDGASPQSLIAPTAAKVSLPAARVDVALDARGTPQSLEAALAELEAQARRSGAAIGFANAQPATIERIARFAREAEKRGIAIAPVSAVLTRSLGAPTAGVDR
jgi:polysaccharide deacetylase 2 family uncharacterized protein YibQ